LLSFKDKLSPNPLLTVAEEASEIISIFLKKNLLFYMDETMRMRVLEVKKQLHLKSKIEQKFFLNCTTMIRDDLIANKDILFGDFHESFISNDFCLHISNRFYRFF